MIIQLRLNTGSFSVGQREAKDSIVNTTCSAAVLANTHAHTHMYTHTEAGVFRYFTIQLDYKSGDCDAITTQFSIQPTHSEITLQTKMNPEQQK